MELLEPGGGGAGDAKKPEFLMAAVTAVTFDSGIKLYLVEAGGTETETPPSGTPHWGSGKVYPAVYVREGGTGEVKKLKVKVEWSQMGKSGSAKLKGQTSTGSIVIEGNFSISGERGTADVSCEFTKRPSVVANLGAGVTLTWTVECAGETVTATGGNTAILYFVDAKPLPMNWSYKAHYLKVVDWATAWASARMGKAQVLPAIWGKFSDAGKGARVPHATGFVYWKTDPTVQDLTTLLQPDGNVATIGWSCRAIAHLFMECLAVHGIKCLEVVIEAPHNLGFLVHNWNVDATPLPNWEKYPDYYYAGTWGGVWPKEFPVPSSLTRRDASDVPTKQPMKIDMLKRPGVPGQGQTNAPLYFGNHWIVEVDGSLYDTSYGFKHANDLTAYAKASLGGWRVSTLPDSYTEVVGSATRRRASRTWTALAIASYTLVRKNGYSN